MAFVNETLLPDARPTDACQPSSVCVDNGEESGLQIEWKRTNDSVGQKGFFWCSAWTRVCHGRSLHPPLQCDSPLTPWHAAALTNAHCRTEQVWACIPIADGERVEWREEKYKAEIEKNRVPPFFFSTSSSSTHCFSSCSPLQKACYASQGW